MSAAILFDLDGTLVDSAPGIVESLKSAFARCGIVTRVEIDRSIVGPPLRQTLARVSGCNDPAMLDVLAEQFKAVYDTAGYRATAIFAGVDDMLRAIHSAGVQCHVVTNKRLVPTRLILEHLGWVQLVRKVHTLDSSSAANKTELVARVLGDFHLSTGQTVLIGDSREDLRAASANGLGFIAAGWGYVDHHLRHEPGLDIAQIPSEVLFRLKEGSLLGHRYDTSNARRAP